MAKKAPRVKDGILVKMQLETLNVQLKSMATLDWLIFTAALM
jgi:hypothetical protein